MEKYFGFAHFTADLRASWRVQPGRRATFRRFRRMFDIWEVATVTKICVAPPAAEYNTLVPIYKSSGISSDAVFVSRDVDLYRGGGVSLR